MFPELVSKLIRGMLALPGVQYAATRFGNERLRGISFDEKFRRGHWNFSADSELVEILERNANGGNILILGCGAASVARATRPDSYRTILGVDISTEAIARANQHASDRIEFKQGDMETFKCDREYNVILFSESLYYVNVLKRKPLLQRLSQSLTDTGVIIVTIAQPQRYAGLLETIRSNFSVVEDRTFEGSKRHLLVFRSATANG